jgi:hypothetical protein
MSDKSWENYEDAARDVLGRIKDDLGLDRMYPAKDSFQGEATKWELDVTAFAKGSDQLVVFECRKRGRNVEKAEMGSFAYTLKDLKAKGFVVSQKQLGKGAQEIARHEGIGHMQFNWDEETGDSVLRWLRTVIATVSDTLALSDGADCVTVSAAAVKKSDS